MTIGGYCRPRFERVREEFERTESAHRDAMEFLTGVGE